MAFLEAWEGESPSPATCTTRSRSVGVARRALTLSLSAGDDQALLLFPHDLLHHHSEARPAFVALPSDRTGPRMMTGPRLPFLESPRCHVEAECIGDDLVKVTNVGR